MSRPIRKFLLIASICALSITACVPVVQPVSEKSPEPVSTISTQPTTSSTDNEVSFVDDLNRKVTIHPPVKRIVSLAPSVTETLYAIGAGDLLVGRTEYCDYPEEVLSLPTIGGFSAKTISVEAIIALEPDLVIGGSTYQEEVAESLEEAGIPTFVSQPANLSEILDAVIILGRITGHNEDAETVNLKMGSRIDEIRTAVSTIPDENKPKVFYEVWHEPYMSAGKTSVVGELIDLAGGLNIFGDLEEEYPTINAEQLIERDPQIIIGPSNHDDQLTADVIGSREGWQNLTAVKNKAIYIVDGNIVSRNSPRIIESLDRFVEILHPELSQ